MGTSIDDQIATFGGSGSGSGASGTDWAGIGKALSGGQQQQQQQGAPPLSVQPGQATAGQAASGAYQGSTSGMNALAQMLMARVLALREASNPASARPVSLQAQQRPAGLLGL